MKRLRVDCTALRARALTTPPAALETLDAELTPNWRRQKRSSRFECEFLYISSFENSVGVVTRFVRRLNCRVLSARVESALRWIRVHTIRDCPRARDHRTQHCRLTYRLVVSNLQSVLLSHPRPALRWIVLTWARTHAWYILHLLRCTNRGTRSSQITSSLNAP